MYLIEKGSELTLEKVSKIIQTFETRERIKLNKYYNYYIGKQDILNKTTVDKSKPCNRIITNYCFNIVQNYLGYLTGVDITYTSDSNIEEIQEIFNYNDVRTTDSELLRNALIHGVAYEISYIDEDMQQRFKVLDSKECIPVYDNTLNQDLLYVIRYYMADNLDITKGYIVEVYDKEYVRAYNSNETHSALKMIEEVPHYYGQVPITVFSLNIEQESVFDKIITLQDAYNKLLSSEVDDFEAFCDAYMVLKGLTAEPEDIAAMKENRVFMLDADADATYLNKSISDTQIENMLRNINDTIHKIANSPDFNDEKLMAQSGIAMRYKLVGFENTSSAIVANMTKALQRRIELICKVLNVLGSDALWRDIEISFTRNLPINTVEIAQMVNQFRGLVSTRTLLAQIPFISDVQKELELLAEESAANQAMYGFSQPTGGEV